ncbi:hypothetical protein D7X96_34505 [Corallococcus interemptor]|uniref:Uncharacterized protein n=1 Tax=Corallococcus interemptor TaxID=2316720 RepID=A0A3A8PVC4_9BACT|nr:MULTISPECIES: hypothetical protein [Corallococcus]RKH43035.1 hypothetical protein D7Y23_30125 [Corallococcus sp. AB050B]RKH59928.1 hypothetical protein D7X96_34505 [Corallococcus interemptor]
MDVPASLLDFSLVQGTLLGQKLRRARHRQTSRPARILVLTLVAWLPLLVLSLLGGGLGMTRAFLHDVGTQVAFLVSLPLLVACERYIDLNEKAAVRQFVVSELIAPKDLATYERIARDVVPMRRSAIIEAGLLAASIAVSLLDVPHVTSRPAWLHAQPQGPLTLAGWWYLAVSMPILRFLLLRWLWRGVLWARFLFKVSRLPLTLVPTHPDAAGGLGFLGTVQASFSLIVLAVSATITTHRLSHASTTDITDYALHLFTFALLCMAVIFAPLMSFFRQLLMAKRKGDHHYSAVAAWHSQRFEERWFHRKLPEGLDPLSAEDFSSLTDLGSSFVAARRMRWFPVDIRAALAVIAAAMAPMVPLLLADRRFVEVLLELGKSLH